MRIGWWCVSIKPKIAGQRVRLLPSTGLFRSLGKLLTIGPLANKYRKQAVERLLAVLHMRRKMVA
jgi:hypothetical protein